MRRFHFFNSLSYLKQDEDLGIKPKNFWTQTFIDLDEIISIRMDEDEDTEEKISVISLSNGHDFVIQNTPIEILEIINGI